MNYNQSLDENVYDFLFVNHLHEIDADGFCEGQHTVDQLFAAYRGWI